MQRFDDALVDGDGERPFEAYVAVDYPAVVAEAGGGRFGPMQEWTTTWAQPFDPELLVERAASVSVVAALDDDEREVVLDRVRELARTHPALAGRDAFDFPYGTRVFWCRRR